MTLKRAVSVALLLPMLVGVAEARRQSTDLLPVPPLAAQAPASPPPTFRSSADLVALNVTVTNDDRLVTGLRSSDFEVYEDGVKQQVQFFEGDAIPVDLILLLDTSASMRASMPIVHEAAREFMKTLRPGDRGAVVAFNDRVHVLQPLTSDSAALERAIDSATASGATSLYNATYIALKQFGGRAIQAGSMRRQAIVVLSDGDDTGSLVTFEDVTAVARRAAVNVYTIALKPDWMRTTRGSFSESADAMKMLARETGARAFSPSTVHELERVYAEIARELRAQYSIAYSPTNGRADGRFRRIVVRVPGRPDVRPRTRVGYSADSAGAGRSGLKRFPD